MDDLLRRAGKAIEGLASSAGRQAEMLKLQADMGSLDDDLDRVFIEAGKRARELLRARQLHDDELRVIVERADAIEDEMMAVRRQISELRQGAAPQPKDDADASDGSPG